MTITVKRFRVRTGESVYYPGDKITELDEKNESKLVDQGHCEFVGDAPLPVDPPSSQDGQDPPDDDKTPVVDGQDPPDGDGPNTSISINP